MTCDNGDRRRHGREAFTLIELLVVMAIISLMVSILLPALAEARRSARGTLCQTRMRSQGQAMECYANDYGASIPLGITDDMHFAVALLPGLGYQQATRLGELFRQSNQAEFWNICGQTTSLQCPDFPDDGQRLDFVVNSFLNPYTATDSGGPPGSGYIAQGAGPNLQTYFVQLNLMKQSTGAIIYLTEAHKSLPTTNAIFHDLFYASQLPLGAYPRIADDLRHPRGINALFFDTHVERMRHEQMDVGWPNPVGDRLRYFTRMPPGA